MKKTILELAWGRIALVSVALGLVIGAFGGTETITQTTLSQGFYCPNPLIIVNGQTCTANGCRRSSPAKDSYWVCNYVGENCPPLNECLPQ